jgi:hypothetical protein
MKTIGLRVSDESLKERIDNLCVDALDKWGQPLQQEVAAEECLELAHAILKLKRGFTKERFCNFQEEIVDVLIMIVQCGIMADLDGLDYWFEKKADKLENALKE